MSLNGSDASVNNASTDTPVVEIATGAADYTRNTITGNGSDDGTNGTGRAVTHSMTFLNTFVGNVTEVYLNDTSTEDSVHEGLCTSWLDAQHAVFQLAHLCLLIAFLTPSRFKHHCFFLRTMLCVGYLLTVIWSALFICMPDILSWNVVFLVVNCVHMFYLGYKIVPDRFSKTLDDVYNRSFKPLRITRKQFKDLVEFGNMVLLPKGALYAKHGHHKIGQKLSILLKGREIPLTFPKCRSREDMERSCLYCPHVINVVHHRWLFLHILLGPFFFLIFFSPVVLPSCHKCCSPWVALLAYTTWTFLLFEFFCQLYCPHIINVVHHGWLFLHILLGPFFFLSFFCQLYCPHVINVVHHGLIFLHILLGPFFFLSFFARLKVTYEDLYLHSIEVNHFVDSPEYDCVKDNSNEDTFQVTISASEDSLLFTWCHKRLKDHLNSDPVLSHVFDQVIGKDISQKLYEIQERQLINPGYNDYLSARRSSMVNVRHSLVSSSGTNLDKLNCLPGCIVHTEQQPSNQSSLGTYETCV